MIVRHAETRAHFEPSVRFYRTIALSFLFLTVVLLGVVIFITSKRTTITIISKEDTKSVNLTVDIAKEAKAGVISGSVTSTTVNWSETYFPTGNKTAEGTAMGEVIVYNKGNTDQILIKTTRLLTPGGVLFRLSDRITVPANGEVKAKVYADQVGKSSEIGPSSFVIPGLSTDRQKIVYAESVTNMVGGVRSIGVLSETDVQSAKVDFSEKIKQSLEKQYNTNTNDKKLFLVTNQNVVVNHKVGEEVGDFIISGNVNVVMVSYSQEELIALLNKEVSSKIDVSLEKLLSVKIDPKLSILSYDLVAGTAQLSVYQDVGVTLDANADKLSPQNFLGKSKDEIERYVLGLNHVSGVEVKFTPSWMSSSPTVPDHIKIVVKSVK